ncbi:MAG TPA: hypothetical protein DCY27_12315 [Desulfobacterales bacterium]|nr:hypothetical protein [Desulfobacterales bacterium]
MKLVPIFCLVGLLVLSACNHHADVVCQVRQNEVGPVAYTAVSQLKPYMTPEQVQALLGPPMKMETRANGDSFWTYQLGDDCARRGYEAPTTVLKFMRGSLVYWNLF